MKASLFVFVAVALCLLLSSCNIVSVNPLSSPENSVSDPRLVGVWHTKKTGDTFLFSVKDAHWMHVVITSPRDASANKASRINDKPEDYDFFPTVIDHVSFLNVRLTDKDVKNDYVLLRYSISPDHVLHLWMMSPKATAAAVRAGKLKGIVTKNSFLVGHPPRPDEDVTLQDTSEAIVNYVHAVGAESLFNFSLEELSRATPAAGGRSPAL